jgi:hypothetical protein
MDGIIFQRLDDFGIFFVLYCNEQLKFKIMINGTIHKRNFDGQEKWYFVEELICDFFFGVIPPNDYYIKSNGKPIKESEVKDWFAENKVVHCKPIWLCSNEEAVFKDDYYLMDIEEGYLNLI